MAEGGTDANTTTSMEIKKTQNSVLNWRLRVLVPPREISVAVRTKKSRAHGAV